MTAAEILDGAWSSKNEKRCTYGFVYGVEPLK